MIIDLSTPPATIIPVLRRSEIAEACRKLNATPSDMIGLFNAPGYPELTTGQLLTIARDPA